MGTRPLHTTRDNVIKIIIRPAKTKKLTRVTSNPPPPFPVTPVSFFSRNVSSWDFISSLD